MSHTNPVTSTDRGVEAKMADVAGDNLLLLLRNPKGVVNNSLLNRVHLEHRGKESSGKIQQIPPKEKRKKGNKKTSVI